MDVFCADARGAGIAQELGRAESATWCVRSPSLVVGTEIDAYMLVAALDIGGVQAKQVWGKQWVKMLAQLYDAATVGLEGAPGTLLGGNSAEGIAARVRVQLEIERIMAQ